MLRPLAALFFAALVACSPSLADANKDGIADGVRAPDNVTQVAPSTPTGTITGVVTTTKFAAIPGANVLLVLGSGFTTAVPSGADGAFRFTNVPAGSTGQLLISKDTFGTVRVPVSVPAGGVNVPISDANGSAGVILLLELNGTVRYQVTTANGRPARAVRALLEVSPAGFQLTSGAGYGTPQGQLSFDGVTDDTGSVVFQNVPSPAELARTTGAQTNFTLVVAGIDDDMDGENEFLGTVDTRSGRDFFTAGVRPVILPENRTGSAPAILATNIESLTGNVAPVRNLLRPQDSVYLVFNQPILDNAALVRITQDDCSAAVSFTKVVKGNVLQITPAGNGWTIGEKHNLLVRATGTESGTTTQTTAFTGFIFGGDLTMPKTPMTVAFTVKRLNTMATNIVNGDTLNLSFDVPLRRLTTNAFIQWNTDLNGNGSVSADDPGEFGNSGGLSFSIAEPALDPLTSTFSCTASGYSRRWSTTLTGLPPAGVPTGTQLRVVFPVVGSGQGGYQTIWGIPFTGQRDGMPTIVN